MNNSSCQKERSSGALGFRSAKLTGCLALPERQPASAMVLTRLNLTKWSIKKEILAETEPQQATFYKQYTVQLRSIIRNPWIYGLRDSVFTL